MIVIALNRQPILSGRKCHIFSKSDWRFMICIIVNEIDLKISIRMVHKILQWIPEFIDRIT